MTSFDQVNNHELEGFVYMIPSDLGGREGPVFSGYRGQFFWHVNGESCSDWIAEHYFEGDKLDPGCRARCKIKLAGTILEIAEKSGMPTGKQFALREGSKIVGIGIITESVYTKI